ncbi:serine/threonine protein kinase, partial [Candidatus Poribacteria bacterium]|nr:serine/threonine protein kinase [Candidatus Poribacteria bacterium]
MPGRTARDAIMADQPTGTDDRGAFEPAAGNPLDRFDGGAGSGDALTTEVWPPRQLPIRETAVDLAALTLPSGAVRDGLPDVTLLDTLHASGPVTPRPAKPGAAPNMRLPDSAAADFLLRERIGSGGQGDVWSALQTSLEREVAVKIVGTDKAPQVLRGFLQEAYTAAELDHPNIVPVYELSRTVISEKQCHLLAMKLVRGRTWAEILEEDRRAEDFSFETFIAKHLAVLIAVCNAVAYAHSKKIAHLDLKPSQVIIGAFGEVFLVDWGLAITFSEDAPRISSGEVPKFRTRISSSHPSGTPAYMAPEQASGSSQIVGPLTDIYLLGATLFEIVSGSPPHNARTAKEAYDMARVNELSPMPKETPEELKALIRESLATDPKARPSVVGEFRRCLEDFLSGAGRQRESRRIAGIAVRRIERAGTKANYRDYIVFEKRMTRALALWPRNQDALREREEYILRFAEHTLASRDLELTQVVVSQLSEGPVRQDMMRRLREAQAQRRRMAIQYRILAGVSAVLLLALIFTGYRWSRDLIASNEAIRLEKDRATAARAQAEEVLGFLVSDLYEALKAIGKLDLLDQVAEQTRDYYDRFTAEDAASEMVRQRAQALRNVGSVMMDQSRYDDARDVFDESLSLSRE